jgi:hypothetical protein
MHSGCPLTAYQQQLEGRHLDEECRRDLDVRKGQELDGVI